VHEPIVARLIANASDRLRDAQIAARQIPDRLGSVTRAEIESALSLIENSLKADFSELRGNLSTAHAAIRERRFPFGEHSAMFGRLAELAYSLEDIEQAAAAADYPEARTPLSLPQQHLVPRGAIIAELDALEASLSAFDKKLSDLEKQQSGAPEFEDQDALILDVTEHAGAQSKAVHELVGQRQIDVRGLLVLIGGLGRVVRSFVSTVAPAVARVTAKLKASALALGRSGREVEGAGGAVVRAAVSARADGDFPGVRFRDFDTAPEMIVVPAGEFMMGSRQGEGDDDERPQRKVAIRNPCAVGIAPVMRGEFAAFVRATNYETGSGADVWDGQRWKNDPAASWRAPGFKQDDDHPVVCVNWHDAQAYVKWLSERSGTIYRLLSEAEWEYCCRAGTASAYSTGDSITPDQANFYPNHKGTTSVFKFPPNAFGLRDMHGNVWEWCEDSWHGDYSGDPPANGSTWGGGDESLRVLRSGSWFDVSQNLRSANRLGVHPINRSNDIGFRVARTLDLLPLVPLTS
jgi:formylglycine-generating enzyme required for sulfatase activity